MVHVRFAQSDNTAPQSVSGRLSLYLASCLAFFAFGDPGHTQTAGKQAAASVSHFATTGSSSAQKSGVVNAPIAPDAIYIGRNGGRAGLSLIDLNGFGQSTGNPAFDFLFGPGSKGKSTFPFNPNLSIQGSLLIPPLAAGSTTENGGSSGVFSLTLNSALDDLLLDGSELVGEVSDMMLGAPLDLVVNNSAPFGCSSGGGSICSFNALQIMSVNVAGPNTLMPTPEGARPDHVVHSGGNPISFAPHPNPPPRLAIPLCIDPLIPGQEPTSVQSGLSSPIGPGLVNLLAPGDPFGNPSLGIPPSGLLAREQNTFFQGPSSPAANVALCQTYMMRQQLGHFLYVADRTGDEVLVINSNTFEVLTRFAVTEPVELAMEPNLRFLAVSSRASDEVVFIDIDPRSSRFHEIVKRTGVGAQPAGIVWEPGNEDVLVCNEGDGTLSIIDAGTLEVRKVVRGLERPFAIAVTPRQDAFGFHRDVYFAYVLERSGKLALYESGPDGVNGWGFDEIIGKTERAVPGPRAIQPDPLRLESGVWIAHEAGVSHVVLESSSTGKIPLIPGELPSWRGLSLRLETTLGRGVLSGSPRDIAFDDQRNFGALANYANRFSKGTPAVMNGKNLVRNVPGRGVENTNEPAYLFVAVGSRAGDAVDVIDLATGQRVDVDAFTPGVQSIAADGARIVMDYFRQ